jgi:hypothetical protein
MIHFRGEGELIRNGFNFYPFREWNISRGFIWRWDDFKWRVRYSVKLSKWLVSTTRKEST